MAQRMSHKLAKGYVGPFQVRRCIENIAYELTMPSSSQIHNIFHVSPLKSYVGPIPANGSSLVYTTNVPTMDTNVLLRARDSPTTNTIPTTESLESREALISNESDDYVDYKGRKADPRKHGGVRAASLACIVELIQTLVFLGNSMNLVRYFLKYMHYSVAQSSNMLTNFVGISYFLTIVAGYINDSYLTKLTAFVLYATIELLGVILLTYQAKNSNLLPPENETPSTFQAAILYIGLGAMAIGIGGSKATLPTHGADQLDHTKQSLISSFFNWYYISITIGGILASTLMVIVASKQNTNDTTTIEVYQSAKEQSYAKEKSYDKFKFLNKALNDDTIEVAQVEETKAFLSLLPIFATTFLLNCVVAQLMTFSVQQGNFMNRKIYNFTLTTQSISMIPLVAVLVLLYLLEQSKRFYGNNEAINKIYQPLVRIGVGLAGSTVSMAVGAIVEYKRLKEFNKGNLMSAFWLIAQTLLSSLSEVITVGGTLELFYSKAPNGMRSICTSLSWCSTSMGYFLSTVLVTVCNSVSGRFGQAWIGGQDLNHDRLDLFYALLSFLSLINFVVFVILARGF
ncbi:PREDICTED: protein NRT1/ PTR FAMILY 4.2-like [Lupinus angustifolius]|uniref:protein NRT1/ PTR FAMILY 4.2-like n=1 Tax=Lupinus angustifolius TaxID=3871 RepID=UPI00092EC37F|nr:PREDICTED: protein NRT1/ PTR FAMILY 4.2-like [Lupinus angustifolius]